MRVGQYAPRGDQLLEQMPVGDAPAVDAAAAGEHRTAKANARFREEAASPALAACGPAARRLAAHKRKELAGFADRPTRVRSQPKLDPVRHRRADLDASSDSMRWHGILKRHLARLRSP